MNSVAVEFVASFLTRGYKTGSGFLVSLKKHEACVLDQIAKWVGLGIKYGGRDFRATLEPTERSGRSGQ